MNPSTVTTMPDVTPWAQFGLAGVVIGVLFWMLWALFRSNAAERIEWKKDMREMHLESTKAIDGLTEVSRELKEAIRTLIIKSEQVR